MYPRLTAFTCFACICLFAVDCSAQLLRRNRVAQVGSSCPGGVCPTVVAPQRGHWSYPGTINSHLEKDHGVATAGLSRQQKLDLHDSLHEGTAPVVRKAPVRNTGTYKTVNGVKASGGSCGVYQPTGGSSGTYTAGLAVGNRDYDGALIVAVSEPRVVNPPVFNTESPSKLATTQPVESVTLSDTPTVVETDVPAGTTLVSTPVQQTGPVTGKAQFRAGLVKAIQEARKENKISAVEAARLRIAMFSPAFVDRAYDLAVTQIAFSTETSPHVPVGPDGAVQAEGINWEGLGEFMKVFVPLLIQLLKAFGVTG